MSQLPSTELKSPTHAYDPATQGALFEGVLLKRVAAFVLDTIIVQCLALPAYIIVFLFGILTLGAGLLLIPFVSLAVAFLYFTFTISENRPATWGMRAFGIEMRTWTGQAAYPVLALFHYALFWVITGGAIATIFVIIAVWLVPFFDSRRRGVHDMLTGVVFINSK